MMFKEYKITKTKQILRVLCSPYILIRGIVYAFIKNENLLDSIANCNYFFSSHILKMWENKCAICGKTTDIMHGFGYLKIPIGKGEYKKVGEYNLGEDMKGDVVKWTGKFIKLRYIECDNCVKEEKI